MGWFTLAFFAYRWGMHGDADTMMGYALRRSLP